MKNNPFKKIENHFEAPSNIKKKLMEEIHALHLIKELAGLFTFKFGAIFKDASSSGK